MIRLMPRKRQRKLPLSSSFSSEVTVSSKRTQATISSFHTLLKRQANLKASLQEAEKSDQSEIKSQLRSVESGLNSLGGIDAYQKASRLGQSVQRGGDSSKVLVQWLQELGYDKESIVSDGKLRMLEIGAVASDNYKKYTKWISNKPIDLHSQHPDIEQQDFLLRSLPIEDGDRFHLVSCSLVLNFVSSPKDRGKMLCLIHEHLLPHPSSLLFLVLPLPCVNNSRYLSVRSLVDLMLVIGFELVKEHCRTGGKVGYWLWRRIEPKNVSERVIYERKTVGTDGPKKNNFAILL